MVKNRLVHILEPVGLKDFQAIAAFRVLSRKNPDILSVCQLVDVHSLLELFSTSQNKSQRPPVPPDARISGNDIRNLLQHIAARDTFRRGGLGRLVSDTSCPEAKPGRTVRRLRTADRRHILSQKALYWIFTSQKEHRSHETV